MRVIRTSFIILLVVFFKVLQANNTPTNFIIIISDDQRWDASGYMQGRLINSERIARFPWLIGTTPNIDKLSSEGIFFDNAFTVFSTCSPSRATMLTGVYPHVHGVTDNNTPFPMDHQTYATLLQANGYSTGYFGKWHHGTQKDRPGFEEAATFYGQGTYFSTEFYDEDGNLIEQTGPNDWVDDVSTNYAIDFITKEVNQNNHFLLVLGFKTPHQPFDPPSRSADLYNGQFAADVPNLNVPPPGQTIGENGGNYAAPLRKYMSTIAGIDNCLGRIMEKIEELEIENQTAVIYVSDNGYFRGEHKLGDKRAPYEESIRIPFIIKYPREQLIERNISEIALNLDLAPTILDIAGISIPDNMQGYSLLPFIRNENPENWRDYFFYQYNHDPEFPTAKARPYIALRHENGFKIVEYEENKSWSELFNTNTQNDPYEIENLINDLDHSADKKLMKNLLSSEMKSSGFLETKEIVTNDSGNYANIKLGKNYNFFISTSTDLITWNSINSVQGNGIFNNYSLSSASEYAFQIIVNGNNNDYCVVDTSYGSAQNFNDEELVVGAIDSWDGVTGGDAIFIFEIPIEEKDFSLSNLELQFTARRKWSPSNINWNADLETLGIYLNTNPFTTHSKYTSNNSNVILLEEAILTPSFPNTDTRVISNNENLVNYIKEFYADHPSYSGGKFLFLRIRTDQDPQDYAYKFYLKSSNNNSSSQNPKLHFYYNEIQEDPQELFYKVNFGQN